MQIEYQLPPQALEVEESLLASCLLGDASRVVDLVTPDDFYRTAHQKIFKIIRKIFEDGNEVEIISVTTALRDTGNLEMVGGATYIYSIINEYPIATNIEYHAKILKDKRSLRDLLEACNKTSHECLEKQDIQTAIDNLQKNLDNISKSTFGKQTSIKIGDLLETRIDHYEELQKRGNQITGIPSGFHDIDDLTAGFQNGDLIIIAGRPSMGKTALGFNIILNAGKERFASVVYSYEMPKEPLVDRMISNESRVDSRRFRSGNFSRKHWEKIVAAAARINDLPIYLEDNANLNHQELSRSIWEHKKRHDIKLCLIDYLQLVDGEKGYNRDIEIGSITRMLKKTAKSLNIPIILISQLNRDLEKRGNRRPILADLRESGSIEQDADIVAFVYRDEYYNKDENNPNRGIAEVEFAKHRNGPTTTIKLKWQEAFTRFEDLTWRKES